MALGRHKERQELLPGPHFAGGGSHATRAFGALGRVGSQDLIDPYRIIECLAQDRVDVVDGPGETGPCLAHRPSRAGPDTASCERRAVALGGAWAPASA